MDKKTILELVRKVKRLADRGVGGEALAAKIKLQRLYKKYNLTDADFVELTESYNRYFILRHEFDKPLLFNLICMILEAPSFNCGENNNVIRVKLTDEQYENILEAFEYYQKMFDEYSRYLMQAIISRNAIGYTPKVTKSSNFSFDDSSTQPQQSNTSESSTTTDTNTDSTAENQSSNQNKTKNEKKQDIDMIKLMKLAVAIESNPWKKRLDNKNLPLNSECDTVLGTDHVKTRDDPNSIK